MVLLKFRKEFARRPYTTLSEISDFMKVTAMRESSAQQTNRKQAKKRLLPALTPGHSPARTLCHSRDCGNPVPSQKQREASCKTLASRIFSETGKGGSLYSESNMNGACA
jgi:hypothetical protein